MGDLKKALKPTASTRNGWGVHLRKCVKYEFYGGHEMIKCVKNCENLTAGKLYDCYGLSGAFHIAVKDDSGYLVNYLPENFELKDGILVAYDETGKLI